MRKQSDIKAIEKAQEDLNKLRKEIQKVIVGQEEVIDQLLMTLLCDSHALLEGVPGLAKTLLVRTIAKAVDLQFKRIQFTPDLMPSDIVGAEVLTERNEFVIRKGPIFANIILADEINRAPPKTQSALLEAMQERQVTIGGQTFSLKRPFFVLATQNPIEQEGTYPLPEAQLDRFMMYILIDYLPYEQEVEMVKRTILSEPEQVSSVLSETDILNAQQAIRSIPVTDHVVEYAVGLTHKTRPQSSNAPEIVKKYVEFGAGPRASQFLILGGMAHAFLNGKLSPDEEDIKAVAKPVLRHRIVRNYRAEADGISTDEIISGLID